MVLEPGRRKNGAHVFVDVQQPVPESGEDAAQLGAGGLALPEIGFARRGHGLLEAAIFLRGKGTFRRNPGPFPQGADISGGGFIPLPGDFLKLAREYVRGLVQHCGKVFAVKERDQGLHLAFWRSLEVHLAAPFLHALILGKRLALRAEGGYINIRLAV